MLLLHQDKRPGAATAMLNLLLSASCAFDACDGARANVPNTWHAQVGQDRIISSVFSGQRGGYFVDLAAAAPVVLSNSRALERDFGWRGLCIEGNDRLSGALRRERTCTVVQSLISSKAANVTFAKQSVGKQGFSRIIATPARQGVASKHVHGALTLENVLIANDAPSVMEYLSLDVEAHELAVLQHFPFHSYRWYAMTIETVEPALDALLVRHGYWNALNLTHPIPGGKKKLLDQLYFHRSIPGGLGAAQARAHASMLLWESAMAQRPFRGASSEETIYHVNCGGVPEEFVATGGNNMKLFPKRQSCSCSI